MRVTDGMRDGALLMATTKTSNAVYAASADATSGIRVSNAADDPAAFARIVSADERIRRLSSRIETLARTTAAAAAAESALASATDLMQRVRETAAAMADGAANGDDRRAAAGAVAQLRSALVGVANTRGAAGYLFAGSRDDAPPFDAAGNFSGDDVALEIESDDGVRLRSNASGASAFTAAGGRDVFADLGALEALLAADDAAGVGAMLADLDRGHEQLVAERSRLGLTVDRMRTSSESSSRARGAVQQLRAQDAEVDATVAYTSLLQAQAAYERTLEVSKRLLSTLSVERMLP